MMAALGAVAQHYVKFPGFEEVPSGLGAVVAPPGSYGFIALFAVAGALELGVWTESPDKEPGNFGDPAGLGQYTEDISWGAPRRGVTTCERGLAIHISGAESLRRSGMHRRSPGRVCWSRRASTFSFAPPARFFEGLGGWKRANPVRAVTPFFGAPETCATASSTTAARPCSLPSASSRRSSSPARMGWSSSASESAAPSVHQRRYMLSFSKRERFRECVRLNGFQFFGGFSSTACQDRASGGVSSTSADCLDSRWKRGEPISGSCRPFPFQSRTKASSTVVLQRQCFCGSATH